MKPAIQIACAAALLVPVSVARAAPEWGMGVDQVLADPDGNPQRVTADPPPKVGNLSNLVRASSTIAKTPVTFDYFFDAANTLRLIRINLPATMDCTAQLDWARTQYGIDIPNVDLKIVDGEVQTAISHVWKKAGIRFVFVERQIGSAPPDKCSLAMTQVAG